MPAEKPSERPNLIVIKGGKPGTPESWKPRAASKVPSATGLYDEGKSLAAMLRAYDEAQVGMSSQDKNAMNQRIVRGEEEFSISGEEMQRRRAALEIEGLLGSSPRQAAEQLEELESAAKETPGIAALIDILARAGTPAPRGEQSMEQDDSIDLDKAA